MENVFIGSLEEHRKVFDRLIEGEIESITECAELIWRAFEDGKKVLLCGNGGSAADAQHIAAEFVGRYETERRALPSLALTTDTSAITAIGNDYGYERVFARQIEAMARKGDVVIGISTSGNSPNVLAALEKAREIGCVNIGMTGANGGKMVDLCDACLRVPSERTARIQEAHITVAHIWCEYIDARVKAADEAEKDR
jgi:D-sedoheptulose 7-phosphate isomerase